MTAAARMIGDLYARGGLQVGEVILKPANTHSSWWIQYQMRKAAPGQRDDVYYEIEEVGDGLRAQVHVRSKTSRVQTELRDIVYTIAEREGFSHTCKTSKDFKVYVTPIRPIDEGTIVGLCDDLRVLFETYEEVFAKSSVLMGVEEKRKSAARKLGEKKSVPWYVNRGLDGECLCTDFDAELKRQEGLRWMPWVGDRYKENRILVVGESNYADDEWADFVDQDVDFTRKVSDYLCIKREERQKGRTLPTIARMLRREDDESIRDVWRRISYMDIVQRCLKDYGAKKDRPGLEDLRSGFRCVSKVIDVIKPRLVIFTGANSVLDAVKMRKVACHEGCSKRNEFGHAHAMIGEVPVLFLPHPVSFGFSHYEWRDYLRASFPSFFTRESQHV